METTAQNIIWHHAAVTREMRQEHNGHRAVNLWFTGLSGSGKSTISHAVEEHLFRAGCRTFVFDGDNVRHGLCRDLNFSETSRTENIRRIAEMVKLFLDAGVIALTAFISPLREDRQRVRALLGDDFIEIYCRCSLEVCEERDVKGLYRKAREGKIQNYTGISSPYENPESPDLILDTDNVPMETCVTKVMDLLRARRIMQGGGT